MSAYVKCVEPREIWYRYVDARQGFFDPDGDYEGIDRPVITLQKYQVIRHTPKGVWVAIAPVWQWSEQRFVLNNSRKKYAYPNKADAWESFKIRKERQLGILASQHDHVAGVLRLIEEKEKGPVARCVPALD